MLNANRFLNFKTITNDSLFELPEYFDQNVSPTETLKYDLGDTTHKWRALYVGTVNATAVYADNLTPLLDMTFVAPLTKNVTTYAVELQYSSSNFDLEGGTQLRLKSLGANRVPFYNADTLIANSDFTYNSTNKTLYVGNIELTGSPPTISTTGALDVTSTGDMQLFSTSGRLELYSEENFLISGQNAVTLVAEGNIAIGSSTWSRINAQDNISIECSMGNLDLSSGGDFTMNCHGGDVVINCDTSISGDIQLNNAAGLTGNIKLESTAGLYGDLSFITSSGLAGNILLTTNAGGTGNIELTAAAGLVSNVLISAAGTGAGNIVLAANSATESNILITVNNLAGVGGITLNVVGVASVGGIFIATQGSGSINLVCAGAGGIGLNTVGIGPINLSCLGSGGIGIETYGIGPINLACLGTGGIGIVTRGIGPINLASDGTGGIGISSATTTLLESKGTPTTGGNYIKGVNTVIYSRNDANSGQQILLNARYVNGTIYFGDSQPCIGIITNGNLNSKLNANETLDWSAALGEIGVVSDTRILLSCNHGSIALQCNNYVNFNCYKVYCQSSIDVAGVLTVNENATFRQNVDIDKDLNVLQNFEVVGTAAFDDNVVIVHGKYLDLGYFKVGRELNAGKIGYEIFSGGVLEIVGAGTTAGLRRVLIYDDLEMEGNIYIPAPAFIDYGFGAFGKEVNAGRIGYGLITAGYLDVVGAGTTSGARKILLYDEVTVGVKLTVSNVLYTTDTGCVGVNVSNPIYALHISGTMYCSATANFNSQVNVAGNLAANAPTDSTSTSTGSIVTAGGVGIAKALFVGTTAQVNTTLYVTANRIGVGNPAPSYTLDVTGTVGCTGVANFGSAVNVTGDLVVSSTTDSTSISTGSIVTAGGVGIAKNLVVGTGITAASLLMSASGTTLLFEPYMKGVIPTAGWTTITPYAPAVADVGVYFYGSLQIFEGLIVDAEVVVSDTTNSTSTSTGSIVTAGGVGIAKALTVGDNLELGGALHITGSAGLPAQNNTGNAYYVGGQGSANSGRIVIGDGTGWSFRFSKRISSVTTDVVTVTDSGGITVADNLELGGALHITGSSSLPAQNNTGNAYYVGGQGSANSGRIVIGDGSGWAFRFSKRISSVTTDVVTVTDSGGITAGANSDGNAYASIDLSLVKFQSAQAHTTSDHSGTLMVLDNSTTSGSSGGKGGSIVFAGPYKDFGTDFYGAAGRIRGITSTFAYGGDLTFETAAGDGTLNRRVTIQNDGNVGIMTTTPAYTLDVNGVVRTNNNFICLGYAGINTSTLTYALNVNGTINATGNIFAGGYVGVGTTSPSVAVDVVGNVKATGDIQTTGGYFYGQRFSTAGGSNYLALVNGGTNTLAGNTSISGTLSISSTLSVAGVSSSLSVAGVLTLAGGGQVPNAISVDFGYNTVGKETNAGRVGYALFGGGTYLDIVGAGTSSPNRYVRIFDYLDVQKTVSALDVSSNTVTANYITSNLSTTTVTLAVSSGANYGATLTISTTSAWPADAYTYGLITRTYVGAVPSITDGPIATEVAGYLDTTAGNRKTIILYNQSTAAWVLGNGTGTTRIGPSVTLTTGEAALMILYVVNSSTAYVMYVKAG